MLTAILMCALMAAPGDTYRAEVEAWRQQREAKLRADWGWPTVAGLFWLKPGATEIGAAASNAIVLPAGAPEHFGTLHLQGEQALFRQRSPQRDITLRPYGSEHKDVLSTGSLQLMLLKRGERFAVRLKDNNSRARREFKPLSWFPVDAKWRVEARLIPFKQPTTLTFETAVGTRDVMESPGMLEFTLEGKKLSIQPVLEDGRLFIVMKDLTSGKTTYGASRFLYAEMPKNGKVTLDFNKAENPPCVFTPWATCPLPPPQNRLNIAVTAGEKNYTGAEH